MAEAKKDQNYVSSALGVSSVDNVTTLPFKIDPITGRVLTDSAAGGSGTVTSITQGTGILLSPSPITTTGSVSLSTALQPIVTLTGNSLKVLRVNVGETAVEYATPPSTSLTVGTTVISSGTNTRILYDNSGVLGEYSVIPVSLGGTNATSASITAFNNITGYTASGSTGTTSTNLVFSTSPNLTTPVLGVATATSINKVTITAPTTAATLVFGTDNATITFQGTDTYVGRATTDTLTNKTLTAPAITGATTIATGATITTPTITKPVMNARNQTAQTYSPAGAGTATLDLSLGDQHDITMPAGNITIALSNDTNNQIFSISITQDSGGSRTVTWFTTIKWAGGSPPTLTTTANKRDRFTFVRTGSGTYDGMVAGQNI